ncbi:hypothetical protein [Holdemanella biformis]|uniref:hypothetical protein n=2 Tax=Holdemanella biformis TaxID=1735 RepID=UPI002E767D57|nr:hypothetical protein [Holdemanella biformis]MEE0472601.1 hypothetical protein [Holdemanella biformis]MEE0668675.1 hypothetical protein [Holdemanella biformis]
MSKEMRVVVYQNSETENGVEYSLIYEGITLINETTTARDVFDPLGIEVPLNVYLCFKNEQFNDKYTRVIGMSYYFDDGVLKTNFNPVDAKIFELNDYGYEFDHLEFLVDTLGGIGAGGALDFLKQFYDAANELYQQNSLAFDCLILPTIKIMLSKAFDIIENNLHYYDSFEQGLKFQKEYTLDSFTKALQLEEIRSMNDEKTYFQMVNAFLIVYGYKYDYEDDKWIK